MPNFAPGAENPSKTNLKTNPVQPAAMTIWLMRCIVMIAGKSFNPQRAQTLAEALIVICYWLLEIDAPP